MNETTIDRVERGVAVVFGLLIASGAAYDLRQFRKRKQTFSTLIWLLQRNKIARFSLATGWVGLTLHLFLEPILRKGKASMVLRPIPVMDSPLQKKV